MWLCGSQSHSFSSTHKTFGKMLVCKGNLSKIRRLGLQSGSPGLLTLRWNLGSGSLLLGNTLGTGTSEKERKKAGWYSRKLRCSALLTEALLPPWRALERILSSRLLAWGGPYPPALTGIGLKEARPWWGKGNFFRPCHPLPPKADIRGPPSDRSFSTWGVERSFIPAGVLSSDHSIQHCAYTDSILWSQSKEVRRW